MDCSNYTANDTAWPIPVFKGNTWAGVSVASFAYKHSAHVVFIGRFRFENGSLFLVCGVKLSCVMFLYMISFDTPFI